MKALKVWLLILNIISGVVALVCGLSASDLYQPTSVDAETLAANKEMYKITMIVCIVLFVLLLAANIIIRVIQKRKVYAKGYKSYSFRKKKLAKTLCLIFGGIGFAVGLLITIIGNGNVATSIIGLLLLFAGLVAFIIGLSLRLLKKKEDSLVNRSVNNGVLSLVYPRGGIEFDMNVIPTLINNAYKEGFTRLDKVIASKGMATINMSSPYGQDEIDKQQDRALTYIETNGANKEEMPEYYFNNIVSPIVESEIISTSQHTTEERINRETRSVTKNENGTTSSRVVSSVYDHTDIVTWEVTTSYHTLKYLDGSDVPGAVWTSEDSHEISRVRK